MYAPLCAEAQSQSGFERRNLDQAPAPTARGSPGFTRPCLGRRLAQTLHQAWREACQIAQNPSRVDQLEGSLGLARRGALLAHLRRCRARRTHISVIPRSGSDSGDPYAQQGLKQERRPARGPCGRSRRAARHGPGANGRDARGAAAGRRAARATTTAAARRRGDGRGRRVDPQLPAAFFRRFLEAAAAC